MEYVSIAYAYPSSINARKLGCGKTGCYYVTEHKSRIDAGDIASGPYDTATEAYAAAVRSFPGTPVLPHDKPYVEQWLAREKPITLAIPEYVA